jgi:hypothetical protein
MYAILYQLAVLAAAQDMLEAPAVLTAVPVATERLAR